MVETLKAILYYWAGLMRRLEMCNMVFFWGYRFFSIFAANLILKIINVIKFNTHDRSKAIIEGFRRDAVAGNVPY
jgi:hypothetical protein